MVVPCINHTSPSVSGAATAYPYPSTAVGTSTTSAKIKFPLGIPLACSRNIRRRRPPPGVNPRRRIEYLRTQRRLFDHHAGYICPTTTTKYTTGTVTRDGNGHLDDRDRIPGRSLRLRATPRLSARQHDRPGLNDDTTIDCCTVLLQRMADPTMPYDEYQNPYITVDWMNVDLTVFNGQSSYLANGTALRLVTTARHFYDGRATPRARTRKRRSTSKRGSAGRASHPIRSARRQRRRAWTKAAPIPSWLRGRRPTRTAGRRRWAKLSPATLGTASSPARTPDGRTTATSTA